VADASASRTIIGAAIALIVGCALFIIVGEIGVRLLGYGAIFDVHSKPSIFWVQDPLLGWRHEPNAEGTYVGPRPWPVEWSTPLRINSLGLRGPELEAVPPGGYRVLALGDSLTAAFEVPYEETFTALLEEKLTERSTTASTAGT
jgi:hypothetical protein